MPASPKHLGPVGKRQYQRLIKSLPPLTPQQQDLVTLACDAWETYLTAGEELQRYYNETNTVCSGASPHGAWRVQVDARNAYRQLIAQLQRSLATSAPDEQRDELDDLTDRVADLL